MGEETIACLAVFGHGFPREVLWLSGKDAVNVTRPPIPVETPSESRLAAFLEPFLDPFARAFLLRLEQGTFDRHAAIIFLREAPGALHAYRYALEFRRLGLLPATGPALFIFNLLYSADDEASRFNDDELDRLNGFLAGVLPPEMPPPDDIDQRVSRHIHFLVQLARAQSAGDISAADAFNLRLEAMRLPLAASVDHLRAIPEAGLPEPRPPARRYALLGSPLAGDGLHRLIERCGILALDLQSGDPAPAVPQDIRQAIRRYAEGAFAPRQTRPDAYVEMLGPLLAEHRIDTVVWQVDPTDDLWGWLMPDVRDLCKRMEIGFVDLGFVPTWPDAACLDEAGHRLRGARP